MHRKLTYHISAAEQDFTVKQYLKSKGFSTRSMIELKKQPENVTVKNTPVFMNQRLSEGDTLTLYIRQETASEKIPPVKLPLDIVYEDEDLLVVNKPAGMPTHPSMNHYENTLANGLAWYFEQQGIPFVFRCVGRLDRDTSGLTVIAKHYVSAGMLSDLVAKKGADDAAFHQEYLAIVRGTPAPDHGTVTAPLSRKPGSVIERTVDFDHGEAAVTHYRTIEQKNGHSLVSLHLETGRTHQIRIHMKYLGFPLIGDYLYNPDMEYIARQALHSHKISFRHPISGKWMEFTAPLPEDMRHVLEP